MRTLVLLAIVPTILAAAPGRIERVNFDLGAPSRQIAITATEGLDTSIEASIRRDGALYDVRDWTVLLWYGTAATNPPLGLAFTNAASGRGWARWDIDGAMLATNGRFDVQIVASHSDGTVQEWARGYMTIRADSTSTFQPVTFGAPLHAVSNALAAAIAVASTNLQGAITAEAQARASGDAVSLTNWQAVVYSLTNGAALGATALQPPATNTLAAAAAHAATAHEISTYGGFRGGSDSEVTFGGAIGNAAIASDGGAVGDHASTDGGGAVGAKAYSEYGGAVGVEAKSSSGGAVGYGALTSDGAAIGLGAYASSDGTQSGAGIDAIQLGTGGNSEPFSLQIYSHKLMHADGTIPVERFAATLNASNTADRAYTDAAIAAIYTPVYAATTTIAVNSTQAVYKATFGTAGTVTQSIDGLTVSDTQEARWELWLNATNPAALSPTWQGNLDWINGTPELTVTGLYKFAMSTTGTRITGRQTYPTVYTKTRLPWVVATTGAGVLGFPVKSAILGTSETTNSFWFLPPEPSSYHYVSVESQTSGESVNNNITAYLGYRIDGVTSGQTDDIAHRVICNGASRETVNFIVPPLSRLLPAANSVWWTSPIVRIGVFWTRASATSGAVILNGLSIRPANELEIKSYNAGWRP